MNKGRSSKGPCGGAGGLAGKGLSQFSGQRHNGNGRDREERFNLRVAAHLNFPAHELRGHVGVLYVGKKTDLATKLERLENGEIAVRLVSTEVSRVNYFTMRVEEWVAKGYGRVFCTQTGKPLPRHKLRNGYDVGTKAQRFNGLVQPAYAGLNHVFMVEAVGRDTEWHVTSFWFIKESKRDAEIRLGNEQFSLTMPESLARRFYLNGSDVPVQEELEKAIRDHIAAEFTTEEERSSWNPLVTAMALAYRKSRGDQQAYLIAKEDEPAEEAEQPTTDLVEEVAEEEEEALQPTGTGDASAIVPDPQHIAGLQAAAQAEEKPHRGSGGKKRK